MDAINYIEVVKWALIVLGAGFIGHFGRVFAEYLMDRARKKRTFVEHAEQPEAVSAARPEEDKSKPEEADSNVKLKAEKKALKANLKLRKKGK